jgi:hypothetical protein
MATGWVVWESKPGGGNIFHTYPDQPCGPPSLLYSGYCIFRRRRKQPEHNTDPTPPFSAEVLKQIRAITLLSLRAFVACKKGETEVYYSNTIIVTILR